MDDRFLCIKVITDQLAADRACSALEEAGIPVILEHLEVGEGDEKALGFRLLTPSASVQHALKIIELQGRRGHANNQGAGQSTGHATETHVTETRAA